MKFLDWSEGVREPFGRRWIIFVSVSAQKLLKVVAKPMARLGSLVEIWLNLLLANGGFFSLALNGFKDRRSESFLSVTGYIDKRGQFDSNIGVEDKIRYNAALCMMAAKVSYENHKYIQSTVEDHWKMDFLGSYDFWNDYQEKATTHAFVLENKKEATIVVAFRGTEPFNADAWSSDLDISWYHLPSVGKIHGGFAKALGLQKSQGWPQEQDRNKPDSAYYAIRKMLKERLCIINNDNAKFIVTGHSLGGDLAALFPAVLVLHDDSWLLQRLQGIYTFGQPRVGDEKFCEYMEKTIEKYDINYYRFVYGYDMVARLPWDDSLLMFKHFGTCIYYKSLYQGKVVDEEPDKNYFSIMWIIPKIENAWWELIRSFTISCTIGADYQEGGFLRMVRVIGLFAVGFPDHLPQDYVNVTRLASPDELLRGRQ